jgi:hypothetical protein
MLKMIFSTDQTDIAPVLYPLWIKKKEEKGCLEENQAIFEPINGLFNFNYLYDNNFKLSCLVTGVRVLLSSSLCNGEWL